MTILLTTQTIHDYDKVIKLIFEGGTPYQEPYLHQK